MLEHTLVLQLSSTNLAENTSSQLRQEYLALQKLFQAQPASQQQYLRNQAAILANAILDGDAPIQFSLPESVVCLLMMDCSEAAEKIPPDARQQRVGSLLNRFIHPNLVMGLDQRLTQLEKSSSQAISVSAGLIRYSVAVHIIHDLLPTGNSVVYASPEDDDIPNHPVVKNIARTPSYPGVSVNRLDMGGLTQDHEMADWQVGYVNSFFLPEYVAFDYQNRLLTSDLQEAAAHIQAMRRYLLALNAAVSLAPYMVVDDEFQAKRYGISGQLVNQARAYASYQVEILCQTIKRRSVEGRLDRGLSLSIPYFNDQTFTVENYKFDVIPGGRVMFVPAFLVLAVRAEAKKILQHTQLSLSTRKSLLQELCIIERAFLR